MIAQFSAYAIDVNPLHRRTLLVTGAAAGIGRAVALHLAMFETHLVLVDRDEAGLAVVAGEIDDLKVKATSVTTRTLDIRDAVAVAALFDEITSTVGCVHGLVNCAGEHLPAPLAPETSSDVYNELFNTFSRGAWNFCQSFLTAAMTNSDEVSKVKGGFSIVNITSTLSMIGFPFSAAYCGAKHAVLGYSRAMAAEYATKGCRINVVAPGPFDTPGLRHMMAKTGDTEEDWYAPLPMQRLGDAQEAAPVVAFLLGSHSSFITGACIPLDGGWTAV